MHPIVALNEWQKKEKNYAESRTSVTPHSALEKVCNFHLWWIYLQMHGNTQKVWQQWKACTHGAYVLYESMSLYRDSYNIPLYELTRLVFSFNLPFQSTYCRICVECFCHFMNHHGCCVPGANIFLYRQFLLAYKNPFSEQIYLNHLNKCIIIFNVWCAYSSCS